MLSSTVTETSGWILYFKNNLSTEQPVDDSTHLDTNGVEWEKYDNQPLNWEQTLNSSNIDWKMTRIRPRLSLSARKLAGKYLII